MAVFIVRFVIHFHYSCIGNIEINTSNSLLYLFSRCDIWNLEPIEIYTFLLLLWRFHLRDISTKQCDDRFRILLCSFTSKTYLC